MKVLLFGRTGQVATEIGQLCAPDMELTVLGREEVDLTHPRQCADAISQIRPQAVINAAAYTNVDGAEADPETAMTVNASAPIAMAEACNLVDASFLHVSTDYVFDGSGQMPWQVGDATVPINSYGRSKLAGEEGIRKSCARHIVLRTSWVFSAHGGNFVKTMLRLGEQRERIGVVADQVGGPTFARDIAGALLIMARSMRSGRAGGTYHFAGTPDVSWADLAESVFERAGMNNVVDHISSAEFVQRARRPLNSRLDCSATARDFAIHRPHWRPALDAVLHDLKRDTTS